MGTHDLGGTSMGRPSMSMGSMGRRWSPCVSCAAACSSASEVGPLSGGGGCRGEGGPGEGGGRCRRTWSREGCLSLRRAFRAPLTSSRYVDAPLPDGAAETKVLLPAPEHASTISEPSRNFLSEPPRNLVGTCPEPFQGCCQRP